MRTAGIGIAAFARLCFCRRGPTILTATTTRIRLSICRGSSRNCIWWSCIPVYLEVKDAKANRRSGSEAMGRLDLVVGVTRDSVKPGDTVKARCHQLRDGTNGCLWVSKSERRHD
jgi:hypothetical protein